MVSTTVELPAAAVGLLQDMAMEKRDTLGLLSDWLQDNPEYAGPVLLAVAELSEWCDYDPAPGDSRFGTTEYVVEGTSCERFMLCESIDVDWQQDALGVSLILGRVGNRAVVANFTWDVINGHRVLWCEMVSEVTDGAMLERWLIKHCYPMLMDGVSARCDAMNFHLCLEFIRSR